MSEEKADVKVGDRVSHPKLGEGDIIDLYSYGEDRVAIVSFEKWGQKKIVLKYAGLTVAEPPKEEEAAGEEREGAGKEKKTRKSKRVKQTSAASDTKKTQRAEKPKKSKKKKKKKKKA